MTSCLRRAALVLAVAGLLLGPSCSGLRAQGNARPGAGAGGGTQDGSIVKVGRLLELETKGKITTLKIETTDGDSYDTKLTPQIDFSIVGPGDPKLLRAGLYLSGRALLTEEKLFLQKVTVTYFPKGKRPPAGRIQKAPLDAGANAYDIEGEIVSVGPVAEYPEYTGVVLKLAGRNPPIWLEPKYELQIASTDPAHTAPGADLELLLKPLRGNKFQVTAIRVQREAPFTTEELGGASAAKD